MTDNMWMDAIVSKKLGDKIEKLIFKNQCDVIIPFSNWLLQYFHSSLDVPSFNITFLTNLNLSCHNHPLLYADDLDSTSELLKQYHFFPDHGTLFFGDTTKENFNDNWDSEAVDPEELSYLQNVDEGHDVMCIVLSPPDSTSNDGETEASDDVQTASSGEVSSNNVNLEDKSTKNSVSNYSVYHYVSNHLIHQFPFHVLAQHLGKVEKYLTNIDTNDIKSSMKPQSYSMLTALEERFSVVMYSKTHVKFPKVLHQCQGIRLNLSPGMIIIFNVTLFTLEANLRMIYMGP